MGVRSPGTPEMPWEVSHGLCTGGENRLGFGGRSAPFPSAPPVLGSEGAFPPALPCVSVVVCEEG